MKKYFIAIIIMALSYISVQAQYIQGPSGPVAPNTIEIYWYHGLLTNLHWEVTGGTILDSYWEYDYFYVEIQWGSYTPGRVFLYQDGTTLLAVKTIEICSNIIEVAIDSIQFCYGSSGSLDIRKDADENIPLPEYIAGPGGRNGPFAYIKSQQDRKIKVKFSSEDATTMTLIVDIRCITGYGPGEVVYKNLGQVNINNYIEITLSDADVPNTIGKRTYTWEWKVYAIPVGSGCSYMSTFTTQHTYYTLLATPQAPMSEPWTDVLDYACVWAGGKSSQWDILKYITEGIYAMGDTDGDIDYIVGSTYSPTYNSFLLTLFFNNIEDSSNVQVNCTDCANLVSIFTAAVGCQAYTKRIYPGFTTNSIDPIGNPGWSTPNWTYHQFGWVGNTVNDACLRLYESGYPIVPTNKSQNDYNTLLINGTPPANYDIYTTQIVEQ